MFSTLTHTHTHINDQEVVKTISKGRGRKGTPNLASQDQNVAMRNPPKCGIETGLEMGGGSDVLCLGANAKTKPSSANIAAFVRLAPFFLPRISRFVRTRGSVAPPSSLALPALSHFPKHYNLQA